MRVTDKDEVVALANDSQFGVLAFRALLRGARLLFGKRFWQRWRAAF